MTVKPEEHYRLIAQLQEHSDTTRAAYEQRLEEQGRECPSCGVRKLPEAFGTKRNGKPQDICKLCLQDRRDATRAAREGFESVEAMREHYAAKKLARQRAKAAKRFNYKPTKDYKPIPQTQARQANAQVMGAMQATLAEFLKPYGLMRKLCEDAAIGEKLSPKNSFGRHLRHQWFTHEDIEPYMLDVRTRKRWVGMWPFVCGRRDKPFKPIRRGEYWPRSS